MCSIAGLVCLGCYKIDPAGEPRHTEHTMSKLVKKGQPYPAVFNPAPEGGFDVSFPDFPGCVTFGQNFEEAKNKAQEVLELWIEELQDNGEEIPRQAARPIVDDVLVSLPAT